MSEECFEFVEDWFAETRGYVTDDAGDRTADRVVGFFSTKDALAKKSAFLEQNGDQSYSP